MPKRGIQIMVDNGREVFVALLVARLMPLRLRPSMWPCPRAASISSYTRLQMPPTLFHSILASLAVHESGL
ncbi:MAG: hypothetical protein DUD39_14205 [Coriobacteriaceae bacterium]|nr:MAG: hypothetical protein DUD39_14205 [Coriobacteriaceae bacterium]